MMKHFKTLSSEIESKGKWTDDSAKGVSEEYRETVPINL